MLLVYFQALDDRVNLAYQVLNSLLGLLVVESLSLLLGKQDSLEDLKVVTCELDCSFPQRLLSIWDIEYRVLHLLDV